MNYGFSKEVNLTFEEALEKVTQALKQEGFGVLTEIDVKSTLKNKLDVDFRNYKILGACNPPLAYEALNADAGIGLLLPCNVIVYENENGKNTVAAINADSMLSVVSKPEIKTMAEQVNNKLRKVIDSL